MVNYIFIGLCCYVVFGVLLWLTTFWLYKKLIGLKDVAKKWKWYKKYAFSLIFLYGFIADVVFNLVYAGTVHVYLAWRSGWDKPLSVFLPSFEGVTWSRIYLLTVTKRVQRAVDIAYATKKYDTKLSIFVYNFSQLLNKYDEGHVEIPEKWGVY